MEHEFDKEVYVMEVCKTNYDLEKITLEGLSLLLDKIFNSESALRLTRYDLNKKMMNHFSFRTKEEFDNFAENVMDAIEITRSSWRIIDGNLDSIGELGETMNVKSIVGIFIQTLLIEIDGYIKIKNLEYITKGEFMENILHDLLINVFNKWAEVIVPNVINTKILNHIDARYLKYDEEEFSYLYISVLKPLIENSRNRINGRFLEAVDYGKRTFRLNAFREFREDIYTIFAFIQNVIRTNANNSNLFNKIIRVRKVKRKGKNIPKYLESGITSAELGSYVKVYNYSYICFCSFIKDDFNKYRYKQLIDNYMLKGVER